MIKKPNATSKRIYYSMGDVCEMFDLPASKIRFWCKSIKSLNPKTNTKGNRLFRPNDIEMLKLIYNLVEERGMTLSGASQYLQTEQFSLKKNVSAVELLQQVRATLIEIREDLHSKINPKPNQILIEQNIDEVKLDAELTEQSLFDLDTLT